MSDAFWSALARLLDEHPLVIDRPRGSVHPRHPGTTYPLDYGYLDGTTAVDGGGVDAFVGTDATRSLAGVACTVDPVKHDVEVKLLVRCSEAEVGTAVAFLDGIGLAPTLLRAPDATAPVAPTAAGRGAP